MIQDNISGVAVEISASVIMAKLFGFAADAYYRDVLVLFGCAVRVYQWPLSRLTLSSQLDRPILSGADGCGDRLLARGPVMML